MRLEPELFYRLKIINAMIAQIEPYPMTITKGIRKP
jgi:hypothetical protein